MKLSRIVYIFIVIMLFYSFVFTGCNKSENAVLSYLENAEIQYEGESQRENIVSALNDILNLKVEELKNRKYDDYEGEKGQWDLPTLIQKHFVPDSEGKSLGNNFYRDIKSKKVQDKITEILKEIRKESTQKSLE